MLEDVQSVVGKSVRIIAYLGSSEGLDAQRHFTSEVMVAEWAAEGMIEGERDRDKLRRLRLLMSNSENFWCGHMTELLLLLTC